MQQYKIFSAKTAHTLLLSMKVMKLYQVKRQLTLPEQMQNYYRYTREMHVDHVDDEAQLNDESTTYVTKYQYVY